MMSRARLIVIDTSVIVDAFHFDAAIVRQLTSVHMFVPMTVLGELFYGAYGASKQGAQLRKIEDLIATSTVIAPTQATAQQYGRIRHSLRLRGLPIPDNDIWIAAIALEHDLPLAARDGHFDRIDGLVVEQW